MAKGGDDDRVILTRAELHELLRQHAETTVAALGAVAKANESPRPDAWRDLAKAPPTTLIPSKLPSGATCDVDVQREIVVNLANYKEPTESEVHISEGGAVPNGLDIRDTNGKYTVQFLQWRFENYWGADLRAYVGKKWQPAFALPVSSAAE